MNIVRLYAIYKFNEEILQIQCARDASQTIAAKMELFSENQNKKQS